MKKIAFFSDFIILAIILTAVSCKKDNPAAASGSAALESGKASITFSSSPAFSANASFAVTNTSGTSATSAVTGSIRSIELKAIETAGTNQRNAVLYIDVASAANTNSGSLTGSFNSSNSTLDPELILGSVNAGLTTTYDSDSQAGTCTITKLTATEIEGTFTVIVHNDNDNTTLSLTSGSFAGKFN